MKPKTIIGIVGIVVFTSVLFINFGKSISSYVNFEQAENRNGKNVHVVGSWDREQPAAFSMESKSFHFFMTDEDGQTRRVVYANSKPNNFDQAERLVVIGEMKSGVFYADEMLLKCPSKYNDARAAEFEKAEHKG